MKSASWIAFTLSCGLLLTSHTAWASLTLSSSLGTTHAGNLVANGSFETGAPPDGSANQLFWATGTSLTPFGLPPGWTSSGATSSYASWGNDATLPQSLNGGAAIPDGNAAVYFGNGAPVFTSQPPTFNADGTVGFPSPPVMTTFFAPVPVILSQSINTPANPAASYKFSFWVSGEGAVNGQQFAERGIFGLQVTNVLAGDPIQYLTVPNGINNTFGTSHLYEYTFTPLNTSQPVVINFINWGHFDLSPFGGANFTTELMLDDVIINAVPEPSALVLAALAGGCVFLVRRRRRRD
jgi:hypothetical protein